MAKKVRVDAEEFADKHAKRTKAALPELKAGVLRVTEAPGKKAAAAVAKMRQNILAAIDDGTWEERTAAVTLESWQDDMIKKGAPRVSEGIDRARPKVVAFATQLIPFQNTLLAEIDEMDDLTLADGVARAVKWIERMAEFKKKA